MNAELKAKWVAALRSGMYQQGEGFLCRQGKHCCLGVLCEVAGLPKIDRGTRFKFEADDEYGSNAVLYGPLKYEVGEDVMSKLIQMNDGFAVVNDLPQPTEKRFTFAEIADYIEATL